MSASALAFAQWEPVSWADLVIKDLQETAGIRVELIPTLEEARHLCNSRQRAAVVVFGPDFSKQVTLSSFLNEGINPFYREGVDLKLLDVEMVRDDTQLAAASIIDQATQVTMLRVILPYMIGRAFERISEKEFINLLGNRVRLPVPSVATFLFSTYGVQVQDGKASLNDTLKVAANKDMAKVQEYQAKVGLGVQDALAVQFSKYNLLGKTWASLTRSPPLEGTSDPLAAQPVEEGGLRPLRRGAMRYQILVPSYTVMFAYSLILTVGWLFVGERAQGTLRRLRTAPLSRSEILLGKVIPCFVLSLLQGVMLLGLGKLVFGMRWGPESWPLWQQALWLLPVITATALSAVGLSLFVAALSRTPIQVAIVGSLLVIAFALVSGCLIPRNLMPEEMQTVSLVTPHAWALKAYTELLIGSTPNLAIVAQSSRADGVRPRLPGSRLVAHAAGLNRVLVGIITPAAVWRVPVRRILRPDAVAQPQFAADVRPGLVALDVFAHAGVRKLIGLQVRGEMSLLRLVLVGVGDNTSGFGLETQQAVAQDELPGDDRQRQDDRTEARETRIGQGDEEEQGI